MRRFLIATTVAFCLLLAAALYLEPQLQFDFQSQQTIDGNTVTREIHLDGEDAGGAVGALGGTAAMAVALIAAAFGLLVAVFAVLGVGLLMAGLFVALGIVFVAIGLPFLAPIVVVLGIAWVILRTPKRGKGAA